MELCSINNIKCPNSTAFPREWARPVHPNQLSAPHVVHLRFMMTSRLTWASSQPQAPLPRRHHRHCIPTSTCNPRLSDRQYSIRRQNRLSETEAYSRALSHLHATSASWTLLLQRNRGRGRPRTRNGADFGRFWPTPSVVSFFESYSSCFKDSSIVSNTCI